MRCSCAPSASCTGSRSRKSDTCVVVYRAPLWRGMHAHKQHAQGRRLLEGLRREERANQLARQQQQRRYRRDLVAQMGGAKSCRCPAHFGTMYFGLGAENRRADMVADGSLRQMRCPNCGKGRLTPQSKDAVRCNARDLRPRQREP
eukprot:gnl/Chilomastix_cuspidata/4701.p5 GENE.gnl/Chilomastix_cuspidata/4701~~gnl/Chilomastix_cuspidata/4701.p5  ORF type:complete len:146 (-),score=31.87 gnl/Chilomastix_cuspidata/4701:543-980(-)